MKNIWRKIARVPARVWLVLFIISAIICVLALRHNNQTMADLRQKVYTADKNGGDVNTALNNLRSYVYAHMNTDLSSGNGNIKPPIQLKYTYQRLLDAEMAKLQATNQTVYTQAQAFCQTQPGASGLLVNGMVPCVQNYIVNHGVDLKLAPIPTGLYEFDFVSPTWSPDLAGWSLVAAAVFLLAFSIRYGATRVRSRP